MYFFLCMTQHTEDMMTKTSGRFIAAGSYKPMARAVSYLDKCGISAYAENVNGAWHLYVTYDEDAAAAHRIMDPVLVSAFYR